MASVQLGIKILPYKEVLLGDFVPAVPPLGMSLPPMSPSDLIICSDSALLPPFF